MIRTRLKSIVTGKKPGDYVVDNDGKKMEPDTVEAALREALKERHGNTYLYNSCHGLRKTFAQHYYDIIRENTIKASNS